MINHCVLAVGTRENNAAHDHRNRLEKQFIANNKRANKAQRTKPNETTANKQSKT